MSAIAAFLARNPLASVLGIVALLASIGAGVQTVRLAWSQNETHAAELAFADYKREAAEESLRVERDAKKRSDDRINELLTETRAIGQVAAQAKTEVRLVQSNGGPCAADPSYLAALRGVQSVLDAGAPAAGGGRPAGPGAAAKVR